MLKRLLYLNYRYLARLDQRLRGRLTPAGLLAAAGFVGGAVFGIDTRQTTAFEIAALFFALLGIGVVCTQFGRLNANVRRRLPQYATAGQTLQYTLCVENPGGKPERDLAVLEQLDGGLPTFEEFTAFEDRDDPGNWVDRRLGYRRWVKLLAFKRGANLDAIALPPLPPAGETEVAVQCLALRRGYLHFRSTLVLRPDPFGLVNAMTRRTNPQALLVLPRRYALPRVRLGSRRRYQPGGVHLASSVGDSREFLGLRDYRPGDPVRHIHWRSWARTGKPIVKEFQDEFFDRQAILLDTFAPAGQIFEEGVSLAASFVLNDWGQDTLIDLLFIGARTVQCTAGRGLGTAARMLELLACAQPCGGRPFSELSRVLLRGGAQLSAAVCILLAWDAQRQALVRRLRAAGVPALVLVVTRPEDAEPSPGCMADDPERFLALRSGNIEAGLRRLSVRAAARGTHA